MEESLIDTSYNDHPEDVLLNFKSISDRLIYGVEAPDGSGLMGMISGYDLKIVFNMSLINTIVDAEAMANAFADVFYQHLMEQLIEEKKGLSTPEGLPSNQL